MRTSIRWRLTLPYAVIIVLTTLGLTLYISGQARRVRYADLQARLLSEARLMAAAAEEDFSTASDVQEHALDALAQQWGALLGQRVTLIRRDGVVLGESDFDGVEIENHLYRAEIQQALATGEGWAVRYSGTLGQDLMYAAVAVSVEGEAVGVVRVAVSLQQIEAHIGRLSRMILAAGALAALCSVFLASYIASRTVAPVRRLTEAAARIAGGDLTLHLLPTTQDEIGSLTRAFNYMAEELRAQVSTLALERNRLAAILNTMADGALLTDPQGEVELVNPAAARILGVEATQATGRTFAQMVHNRQLIELWAACRQSRQEQVGTIETGPRETFLHAVITPLGESAAPRTLVILQDLTRVRRLETVRRDFISNLSHELRTPLASLALVVETLQDGALDEPETARRFLGHMENEVASLIQMVEELLELSRIESGRAPLDIEPTELLKLVKKPLKRLKLLAEHKGVALAREIPEAAPLVYADARRIQQVVGNLVHNAIKFTPAGGNVTVSVQIHPREVVLAISDTGVGIPAADLPRIFERFYKADRARAEDGAGLGLAIAKHLVQSHRGRIWVQSVEGVGSTFYFSLPRVVEAAV